MGFFVCSKMARVELRASSTKNAENAGIAEIAAKKGR